RGARRWCGSAPGPAPPRADDVRRWMLPWAAGEPELPMDVAVDNSNPREIFDLESDKTVEGSFWESVPVSVFVNRPRYDEDDPEAGKRRLWLILTAAGVGALLLVLLVVLALMIILRK